MRSVFDRLNGKPVVEISPSVAWVDFALESEMMGLGVGEDLGDSQDRRGRRSRFFEHSDDLGGLKTREALLDDLAQAPADS